MNADPALRQRAMRSMAMQGRNPSQYTVGGQNSRNPMTGRPEFADMIYTENGWVDPSTGQAMDFGGGNDFANSGTNQGGAAVNQPSGPFANILAQVALARPVVEAVQAYAEENPIVPPTNSYNPQPSNNVGSPNIPPPVNVPLPSPEAPQQNAGSSAPDFGSFSAPQSYDEWRMSRNPGGKGVPNTLFGQTQTAGADGGVTGQGMQMPNVMAGQMPVPGQQWGTPGTALGFARDNTANDPSILKSGYSDISLSPSVYSGAFGGAGFAPQSGIAFSGQGAGGGYGQQQNPQAAGNFGFGNAFRY